jgi:glycosyltransferase involved in cell wall biosynthesis
VIIPAPKEPSGKRLETLRLVSEESPLELSIVMPCLNEAETLALCISKAQHTLDELGIHGEIVIADNGSTDGSQEIALELGARVVPVEEKGYGSALLGGIAVAQGRYVIMGDADDSYDFTDLGPFLEKLREGHELVMGNRFKGGIKPGAMPNLHRYLGTPVLTAVERLFFRSRIGDVNCGLRGFDRRAILGLDLRSMGMEFASEMIVKASLHRLSIAEVPTTLSPDGRSRPPHLSSWRDGWRHLRFLLMYSPSWLFLYPGLLLMLLGVATSLWLFPRARMVAGVGFDVQTLVASSAAIVIGYQSVVFSVLTKVFAISEGLLPEDRRLSRIFRYVNLEVGLIFGFLLLIAGLAGGIFAFLQWSEQSFGALNASQSLRNFIPSMTALSLGFQTVFSSFFLSVLGMRRR